MTMDCEAVKSSLGAWLDGELGGSQVEEIREHLEKCPLCAAERARSERLQVALRGLLEATVAGVAFEPFWGGVRQRLQEKQSWHLRLLDWARLTFTPPRVAWAIPAAILLLIAVFSLEPFLPEWPWGSSRVNLTAVESIDGHGSNVAVYREASTRTIVIWLFQNQEEDDSSADSASGEPSF